MRDLIERLRQTLPGIASKECRGDNLSILLASYFEPGIEDDEMDDTETWKQGAVDAANAVLDAIHMHYANALEASAEREEKLRAEAEAAHVADARAFLSANKRAEKAEARIAELEASLRETLAVATRNEDGSFADRAHGLLPTAKILHVRKLTDDAGKKP